MNPQSVRPAVRPQKRAASEAPTSSAGSDSLGIRAVIFDMDGVLFDSEPLHIEAWQYVLRPLGLDYPHEWYEQFIGVPDADTAEKLATGEHLRLSAPELLRRKHRHFKRLVSEQLEALPGVIQGVARLQEKRVPLALATSGERLVAVHMLACTGLLDAFVVQVTGSDVRRKKPDPEAYHLAARRLGIKPEDCLVLEDSPVGIAAALAAGCRVIAVGTSLAPEKLAGAERLFNSTAEAIDWVLAQQLLGLCA